MITLHQNKILLYSPGWINPLVLFLSSSLPIKHIPLKESDHISGHLSVLPQCGTTFLQRARKKELLRAISRPRFFPGLRAPYQCEILRGVIPGQKQSALSISTATAHIKAETVKKSWRCLSECVGESVGEGCVRVRVHGGAQPDGHPTLLSFTHQHFSTSSSSPNQPC